MSHLKKYTFVPEHQLNQTNEPYQFSVNLNKTGSIYFSKFDVDMYDLDKKVVRIYADLEKKTIAWKEITEGNFDDLKNVRTLTANPVTGAVVLSVRKLLERIGVKNLPIKNIPVTEYVDTLAGTFKVLDLKNYCK